MEHRIRFDTKVEAQKCMVELRNYVCRKVIVDLEEVEVESMSGAVSKEYVVILRKGD